MASGRAHIVWSPGPEVIALRIAALPEVVEAGLARVLASAAAEGEARMKSGAPWTDRTGAARSSLSGDSQVGGGQAVVTLSHGVYYGIWLEVSNQGRYAIVRPTVPRVAAGIGRALGGLL
jgi:hypothetical protein